MNSKAAMKNHAGSVCLIALVLLLSSCVSLPGGPEETPRHFSLLAATESCHTSVPQTIKLTITRVAAGLDSDRIAHIASETGELVYISGMRWASETQALVEQRIAQDLETAGFSIITSHHRLAATSALNCELRALHLLEDQAGDRSANFGLSCSLYNPMSKDNRVINIKTSSPVKKLQANNIAKALSKSYDKGLETLCVGLKP